MRYGILQSLWHPVLEVEQGGKHIAAGCGEIRARVNRRVPMAHHHDDAGREHEGAPESGKESLRASDVKRHEGHRPGGLMFLNEKGGDQKAGKNEEEINSDVSTLKESVAEVVHDDRRDGQATNAVQSGNVSSTNQGRFAHISPALNASLEEPLARLVLFKRHENLPGLRPLTRGDRSLVFQHVHETSGPCKAHS